MKKQIISKETKRKLYRVSAAIMFLLLLPPVVKSAVNGDFSASAMYFALIVLVIVMYQNYAPREDKRE